MSATPLLDSFYAAYIAMRKSEIPVQSILVSPEDRRELMREAEAAGLLRFKTDSGAPDAIAGVPLKVA